MTPRVPQIVGAPLPSAQQRELPFQVSLRRRAKAYLQTLPFLFQRGQPRVKAHFAAKAFDLLGMAETDAGGGGGDVRFAKRDLLRRAERTSVLKHLSRALRFPCCRGQLSVR